MSKEVIKGKVYVVGNDIDTDVTIPARYLTSMDPKILAQHAMEDLDPKQYPVPFLNKDGSCDYRIIIAGSNFGCGSSREHAPIALSAVGIEAVVAKSFARIYYRNSVNGGIILPLESEKDLTDYFKTGEEAELGLSKGVAEIVNLTQRQTFLIKPFGQLVGEIIESGGLTAYNKQKLNLQ